MSNRGITEIHIYKTVDGKVFDTKDAAENHIHNKWAEATDYLQKLRDKAHDYTYASLNCEYFAVHIKDEEMCEKLNEVIWYIKWYMGYDSPKDLFHEGDIGKTMFFEVSECGWDWLMCIGTKESFLETLKKEMEEVEKKAKECPALQSESKEEE